jgi:hypothetical protein
MWNQPPCMNIDVSSVYQPGLPTTHSTPGPSGTATFGATLPSSPPGIAPSSHTERASVGSAPSPARTPTPRR